MDAVGAAYLASQRGFNGPSIIDHQEEPPLVNRIPQGLSPCVEVGEGGHGGGMHAQGSTPCAQQRQEIRLWAEAAPENAVGEVSLDLGVIDSGSRQGGLPHPWEAVECIQGKMLTCDQTLSQFQKEAFTSNE